MTCAPTSSTLARWSLIGALLSIACIVLLCAHLGIHDVDSLVHWCGTQLQQLIPSPFARGA